MPAVDEGTSYYIPKALRGALEQLDYGPRAAKIADCICSCAGHGLSAGGVCMLWEMLAQTWVAQCNERYGADGHVSCVSGTAEVAPKDEYTFDRMRLSEQLDLDYLSRRWGAFWAAERTKSRGRGSSARATTPISRSSRPACARGGRAPYSRPASMALQMIPATSARVTSEAGRIQRVPSAASDPLMTPLERAHFTASMAQSPVEA